MTDRMCYTAQHIDSELQWGGARPKPVVVLVVIVIVRKNWLEWHKVKKYKDTVDSQNVSSQVAEVIVMMETTLWTDEISGIDGMMTE